MGVMLTAIQHRVHAASQSILLTRTALTAPVGLELGPTESCLYLLAAQNTRQVPGLLRPSGMEPLEKTIHLKVHHSEQVFSNPIILLLHYCGFFSAGREGT